MSRDRNERPKPPRRRTSQHGNSSFDGVGGSMCARPASKLAPRFSPGPNMPTAPTPPTQPHKGYRGEGLSRHRSSPSKQRSKATGSGGDFDKNQGQAKNTIHIGTQSVHSKIQIKGGASVRLGGIKIQCDKDTTIRITRTDRPRRQAQHHPAKATAGPASKVPSSERLGPAGA